MILSVDLEKQGYDIVIENGALSKLSELLDLNGKICIVTDDGVPTVHIDKVKAQFPDAIVHTFPQGEASKTIETFSSILSTMLSANFTRSDCVIALGGGVTGDMSGFAAACYMRGIDFYNIPTTLLSQIDSSIGGKTAIDFNGIKNAVGAFYQPKKVIIDPDVLETLDERQVHAGLAEAIKMAATSDAELFEFIENSTDLKHDLPEIIYRSLKIKKAVVENDPKETGLRKVLNFGHTVGHAIESYYKGELLHGESVAVGMLPMCSETAADRIEKVLRKYDLPVNFNEDPKLLVEAMLHDKKSKKGYVQAVFVKEIGSFEFIDMTPDIILKRTEDAYGKR